MSHEASSLHLLIVVTIAEGRHNGEVRPVCRQGCGMRREPSHGVRLCAPQLQAHVARLLEELAASGVEAVDSPLLPGEFLRVPPGSGLQTLLRHHVTDTAACQVLPAVPHYAFCPHIIRQHDLDFVLCATQASQARVPRCFNKEHSVFHPFLQSLMATRRQKCWL